MGSDAATDYSSDEREGDKGENKTDKEPGTPYSLRRTKQPPTRYGAEAEENIKYKSPKTHTKHISPTNNRRRSSSKERDESEDEEDDRDESEKRYRLRPRSQISYKEPDNFDPQSLERRRSSSGTYMTPTRATKREVVVYVEADSKRGGLRPRKVTMTSSELKKYKVKESISEKPIYKRGSSDGEKDDRSEKSERESPSKSARSSSESDISSDNSDNSDNETSGSGESESDKGDTTQKLSKKESPKKSPKKSEVRRSKRARIVPERYNPLADQQGTSQPGQNTRPRFPSLPKSWNGIGGGIGGGGKSDKRSNRYYSKLGYDSDSSSSSGDDLPRALPSIRIGASIPQPLNLPRPPVTGSKADTAPVDVDKSIDWDSVGGLKYHIQQLKEMILLPLLYPEVFNRFNVTPPKGVLFYGPPGTGKTLIARALANSCSEGGKKVSFFMRKGADCLSKWVGEAERQLRLLFEQAKSMQPAIIFFDEIDGLAPVRSSKQDQIHSSIVSTLLALMDGLDNRGSVIVIGATNRLDSIDPALRRPGRFDREFLFSLPGREARKEILSIHTRSWQPEVKEELIDDLASMTVGFCGADIKSLCTEALLVALRHRYPQIYESKEKLKINLDAITVDRVHFVHALHSLTPASHRSALVHSLPLSKTYLPLLERPLAKLVEAVRGIFPVPSMRKTKEDLMAFSPFSSSAALPSALYRPRLLLSGSYGMGQSQLGAALLHHLEEFPVFVIDIPSLLADPTAKSIEEAAMHIMSEAKRVQPCVLFAPHVDAWFEDPSYLSLRLSLLSFLNDLAPSHPLLLFATSDKPTTRAPVHPLTKWFGASAVVECSTPSKEERNNFFATILEDILKVQPPPRKRPPKVLAKAAAPAAPEVDAKSEEHILRQFRMILRDILYKMLDDRRYYFFAKDLNPQQFPEYYQMINKPISLSTLLQRCDACHYIAPSLVYADLETLVHNTVMFYSALDDEHSAQKVISMAKSLQDAITAYIEGIDSTVRDACEAILIKRGPPSSPPPQILAPRRSLPSLPSITSPTSTDMRRSSARLRGEKPVYKSLEPPLKRTKTDGEKEGDSEAEKEGDEERVREERSEVEIQDSQSYASQGSDAESSVKDSSFDTTPTKKRDTKEKDSNSTSISTTTTTTTTTNITTTSSDNEESHLPAIGVTYTEKEIVVIGDPDPSVLLALLRVNKLANGKEKAPEESIESDHTPKKRAWDDIASPQIKKASNSPVQKHQRHSLDSLSLSSKPDFFNPSPTTTVAITTSPPTPVLSLSNSTENFDFKNHKLDPSESDKDTHRNKHKKSNKSKNNNNQESSQSDEEEDDLPHNNTKEKEKEKTKEKEKEKKVNGTKQNGYDSEHFSDHEEDNKSTKTSTTTTTNTTKVSPTPDKEEDVSMEERIEESGKEEMIEEIEEEEIDEIEEEEIIQPIVDSAKAKQIIKEIVTKTENYSVEELLEIHARIYSALHRHHSIPDKSDLLMELYGIVKSLKIVN